MTTDSILFNAGSLFFAAWIAIIAGVTITAFGRDLLPGNAHHHPDPDHQPHPAEHIRPTSSNAR